VSPNTYHSDLDYLHNRKMEDKYASGALTVAQIKEVFGDEVKNYVPRALKIMDREMKVHALEINKIKTDPSLPEEDRPILVLFYKHMEISKKRLKNYKNLQILSKVTAQGLRNITQEKIDKAKRVSIWTLHDFQGRRGSCAKCPFHEDKCPSFSVNRYNRWICYAGCGKGDAIDFVMKKNHIPFHQAIDFLV